MLKTLLLLALPFLLLAGARPLLAAGVQNLARVALLPALKGTAEPLDFPACGAGPDVDTAARWLAVGDAVAGARGNAGPGTYPGDPLLWRGWTAWLAGDCAEARAAWAVVCTEEAAGRLAPPCYRLFLRTEGELGSVPRQSIDGPSLARYAYGFGRQAERSGADAHAAFAHRLSLELNPNRDAADRLARLYRQADRMAEAIAVWRGLAAALPDGDEDHWWALAQTAELQQDWEAAAQAYGRGAGPAEEPDRYWMAQGDAWRRAQEWGEAEASYHRAAAVRPDSRTPYERLGHLHRSQENFETARAFYTEAAGIAPDRVGPWYYIGLTYYQDDDIPRARAALQKALTVDPEHASSTYYLAQCMEQAGQPEQAADTLARAIQLHGREPWTWARQLGDWRRDLGDRDGALAAYEQALEWQPGQESIQQRIEEVTGQ